MSIAKIYHNPRCSKSRATLALLEDLHTNIEVIKYLETPPKPDEIKRLLKALKLSVRDILRSNEADYRECGFSNPELTEQDLINLLNKHPKVMERPIVSYQGHAVIGRPPENVKELFND